MSPAIRATLLSCLLGAACRPGGQPAPPGTFPHADDPISEAPGNTGDAAASGDGDLTPSDAGQATRDAGDATHEGKDDAGAPPHDPFADEPKCTSGMLRDPNESEGPEMMPGFACTSCHEASNAASGEGDAPVFAFAGTLYTSGHELDSCLSPRAQGARVIVTDANGDVFSAEANAAGNFFLEDAHIVPPYSAKVVFEGRERAMFVKPTHTDCNACHTMQGREQAKGRILLP